MDMKDATEVNKTIREILDLRKFKGQPLSDLSKKRMANVAAILIVYARFTELRLNQLYRIIEQLNNDKEQPKDETVRETEATSEIDI